MKYILLIFCGLLLLAGTISAQAEPDPPPMWCAMGDHPGPTDLPMHILWQRPGGGKGGPGHGHREDMFGRRKHLEQLRMLKLLELLDLDEEQEIALLTKFKRMRDEEQRLDSLRRVEVDKLATLVESETTEDATIDAQVTKVIELHEQRMTRIRQSMEELGAMLTPRQKAKLVIFHDRFEYEILKRVNEFQRRRGQGPAPGNDNESTNP